MSEVKESQKVDKKFLDESDAARKKDKSEVTVMKKSLILVKLFSKECLGIRNN